MDEESFLLFSDVHLGADLVQHVRPWTLDRLRELARIDRDLAAMLDWYREHPDPDRRWCLVIAGDLVDFIGMSIAPRHDAGLETELNDDEHKHGLGSARDHAAAKMRAVARRHPMVFDRLARFVAAGHRLVLVRGNHDLDFHWEAARDAFVEAIALRAPAGAHGASSDALRARIEFHPWFYYVEGLLYVEHGHQFDAMCNYPYLLAPLAPADPSRLHWSLSDWLLRSVARPTSGLCSDGHGERTALDYLRFAWSLGVVGGLRLAYRYARALAVALRSGRHALTDRARAVREEHERRLAEVADRARVRIEHLRELAAMWPRSVSSGLLPVLRSAFLDRIGVGLLSVLVVAVLAVAGVSVPWLAGVGGAVVAACAGYFVWSRRRRTLDIDPAAAMRHAAARIARILPARFVVMGHTHAPSFERVDDGVCYVNLGHWGVDDLDGEPIAEAPRTHLVLRWVEGVPHAELLRWDPAEGPRPL